MKARLKTGGRSGHQNLKNEENRWRSGRERRVSRRAVCFGVVQYVVTVVCALLGSAVSCYGGLCVVDQSSMLSLWSVCCWAV